jgi:cyclopropane-fatty-acyl-phospholipid synthase
MSTQEKMKGLSSHRPGRSTEEQVGACPTPAPPMAGPAVAEVLSPLIHGVLGNEPPVRIEFWDDSVLGPDGGSASVVVRSPDALRSLLWAPGELGLARAFIAGDLGFRGDIIAVLRALRDAGPQRGNLRIPLVRALGAAQRLGAIGLPLPRPAEEAAPRGFRHSKERDAQVIRHHYDISNDFYEMVLGPTMTYSCAYFTEKDASLETAQYAKHDLVSRKLGLDQRAGMRLLDVGCGWGSMAIHAARAYGATVVGITLSDAQAELARRRVKEAGLERRIDIRVQDYRDLAGERFDAVSSVGMFEHVGRSKMATYFDSLHELLVPTGRLLNHAISSIGGSQLRGRSFIGRYVFPDGELLDVGDVVLSMEEAGFEVRDVESLREHYAKTLRCWVGNLQASWEQAVALVGARRARVWLLYMAASANGFDDGGISIHQVLGVRPGAHGESGMPGTRDSWSRGGM